MREPAPRLILASASPRRREILSQLGLAFDVSPADIEERRAPGEPPGDYASRLARSKALAVATRIDALSAQAPVAVLGADTIVVIDGEVLEKPADLRDAERMIRLLSGCTHEVITAVAVCRDAQLVGHDTVRTRVTFARLSPETQARYAASGEGSDKAGAYAIQGLGSGIVRAIEGSYTNVVGLPAVETLQLLSDAGVVRAWP